MKRWEDAGGMSYMVAFDKYRDLAPYIVILPIALPSIVSILKAIVGFFSDFFSSMKKEFWKAYYSREDI